MLIGNAPFRKAPSDLDFFFFSTPTYPPPRLKAKGNDRQPSRPRDQHCASLPAATPPGSHTSGARGFAPSLLVPYRGRISSWSLSSAGIADILAASGAAWTRNPPSPNRKPGHGEPGKRKPPAPRPPAHDFRRPKAPRRKLLPPTSGPRTRFLRFPAARIRNWRRRGGA